MLRSLLLALLISGLAHAGEPTVKPLIEVERHDARAYNLPLPAYPAGVNKPGKYSLLFKISIDERGDVYGAELPSTDEDRPFAAEVKPLLSTWTLSPAYDPVACTLRRQVVEMRADFIDEGGRKYVELFGPRLKPQPPEPTGPKNEGAQNAAAKKPVKPGNFYFDYPTEAQRRGIE